MSRMCDFCLKAEYDVDKMSEVKHGGLNEAGLPRHMLHLCLDCAQRAVKMMTNVIEGGST